MCVRCEAHQILNKQLGKPLTYYVSQSDSRSYNTAPLETIKSILKRLSVVSELYINGVLYKSCKVKSVSLGYNFCLEGAFVRS